MSATRLVSKVVDRQLKIGNAQDKEALEDQQLIMRAAEKSIMDNRAIVDQVALIIKSQLAAAGCAPAAHVVVSAESPMAEQVDRNMRNQCTPEQIKGLCEFHL